MAPPSPSRPTSAAGRHRLLGDPTRLALINALRAGPRTVPELSEATGMHRNTVRSHLNRLRAAGVVEAVAGDASGRGRPAHSFRISDHGHTGHQPPFIEGLVALVRTGHGDGSAAAAEKQGRAMGVTLARTAGASPHGVVEHAAEVLRRLSFEPTVHPDGDGYRMEIHHCPFWGAPIDRGGDVLCAFHRGLTEGMVNAARPGRFAVTLLPLVGMHPARCDILLQPPVRIGADAQQALQEDRGA